MRKIINVLYNLAVYVLLYLRIFFYKIFQPFYKEKRDYMFSEQLKKGLYNIPIFIISFNRLSYVSHMVSQLEALGFNNINVIDNHSSYPPLLDYYKTINHKVYLLNENYGYMVFWKNELFKKFRNDFYIVTDPDLDIPEYCDKTFIDKFFKTLWKYPFIKKVGFSLKIDDIPNNSLLYSSVMKWEKRFFNTKIKKENIYYAGIDTTFALYVPDSLDMSSSFFSAFRTGHPYEVRHLPWYKIENEISDEDIFYSNLKTNGWSDPVQGFMPDNKEDLKKL